MASKPEAEAMQELASMLWSRFLKERVREELNHELNAYKAEVVSNNGNGTLTVRRPFESVTPTLKAAPSLAYAQPGDMVMVAGIGDKSKALSNAFVLAKADLSDNTNVPVYGMGDNLLDNWYFVGGGSQLGGDRLPVNQRGQTSYSLSQNAYCIDRWVGGVISGASLTLALNSDGILLTKTGNLAGNISQRINPGRIYPGTVCTFSVLVSSITTTSSTAPKLFVFAQTNTVYSVVGAVEVSSAGMHSVTVTIPPSATTLHFGFGAATPAGNAAAVYTAKLVAFKLEVGTKQTLAHQENGTWVLNEVPSYEEELIKCITATADESDTFANKTLATEQQIAYVETGLTASRAYAKGEYFCWNGLLYRATSAIASGVAFNASANGNCESATVGDVMYEHRYPLWQWFSLAPGQKLTITIGGGNYAGQADALIIPHSNSGTLAGGMLHLYSYDTRATQHGIVPVYGSVPSSLSLESGAGYVSITNTNGTYTCILNVVVLGDVRDVLSFDVS